MSTEGKSNLLPEPEFLRDRPSGVNLWYGKQYRKDYDRQVYYLALLGATIAQIAQVLNISKRTVEKWMEKYPEFFEAYHAGKDLADSEVAYSLYKSAIGFSCEETVVLSNKVKDFDEDGRLIRERNEPLLVKIKKNYPPNVTAAIKWLNARQPKVWSERLQINGKLSVVHQLDLSDFSTSELEVINKLGIAQLEKISEHPVEDENGYPLQEIN